MMNYMLLSLFLELVREFVTNAEAYLEPSQISTMELFSENS